MLQGRRTSERFIKPAIPTSSLGLNTMPLSFMGDRGGGGGGSSSSSLNSSFSSATNNTTTIIFAQPASPMDTSICKD